MIPIERLEEFTKDCRHWNGCNLANPPDHLGCSVCLEGGHRDNIVPVTLQKAAELMAQALEEMEWYERGNPFQAICPSCKEVRYYGHADDCKSDIALAAWKVARDGS